MSVIIKQNKRSSIRMLSLWWLLAMATHHFITLVARWWGHEEEILWAENITEGQGTRHDAGYSEGCSYGLIPSAFFQMLDGIDSWTWCLYDMYVYLFIYSYMYIYVFIYIYIFFRYISVYIWYIIIYKDINIIIMLTCHYLATISWYSPIQSNFSSCEIPGETCLTPRFESKINTDTLQTRWVIQGRLPSAVDARDVFRDHVVAKGRHIHKVQCMWGKYPSTFKDWVCNYV